MPVPDGGGFVMISQKDMLDIILTEAIEMQSERVLLDGNKTTDPDLVIQYDLRVVQKEDGTFEWRD